MALYEWKMSYLQASNIIQCLNECNLRAPVQRRYVLYNQDQQMRLR